VSTVDCILDVLGKDGVALPEAPLGRGGWDLLVEDPSLEVAVAVCLNASNSSKAFSASFVAAKRSLVKSCKFAAGEFGSAVAAIEAEVAEVLAAADGILGTGGLLIVGVVGFRRGLYG
jgi:hypothetical protein